MNISQVHMGASEGELPRGSLPDAPDETDDMQDTVRVTRLVNVLRLTGLRFLQVARSMLKHKFIQCPI